MSAQSRQDALQEQKCEIRTKLKNNVFPFDDVSIAINNNRSKHTEYVYYTFGAFSFFPHITAPSDIIAYFDSRCNAKPFSIEQAFIESLFKLYETEAPKCGKQYFPFRKDGALLAAVIKKYPFTADAAKFIVETTKSNVSQPTIRYATFLQLTSKKIKVSGHELIPDLLHGDDVYKFEYATKYFGQIDDDCQCDKCSYYCAEHDIRLTNSRRCR